MNACQNCDNLFPNHIYHNGKRVVLNHRKYCLKCSPLYGGNRRQLSNVLNKRKCIQCGNNLIGKQRKYCSTKCKSKAIYQSNPSYPNERKKRNKVKAMKYLGGKCCVCGFKGRPYIFHFHHKDTKDKEIGISRILGRAWDNIKKELDKCLLLCGNCHSEIHDNGYKDNDWNKWRHKRIRKAIEYLGGKCSKCGYNKNINTLCFHHTDPNKKEFIISDFKGAWKTMLNEVKKCSLLCVNCHSEATHEDVY